MAKRKVYEEVIASILKELDEEHAMYQSLHTKFHGDVDLKTRHVYKMLAELCERIRKEIFLRERT